MSRCQICGKGPQRGHRVSRSKQKSKRVWKPNLQKTTIKGRKMLLCTKCIKRLKKNGSLGGRLKTASR